jgi:pimeloyl-ACP methyl ester carboxylesterase
MPVYNGLYTFLHEGGDASAQTVVLIHGVGGSHLSWPPELRRLNGFRVHAIDLPGHGKSGGVGKQSAGDYAKDVIQFMNDASIWKAFFVGHSLGAAIALLSALQAPERVAGLGLLSCGASLPVTSDLLEDASNQTTYPQVLPVLLDLLFGPQADERLKERSGRLLAETRPAVLYGDLVACNTFNVIELLNRLIVPTLILCGTEDRMTPLQNSRALANAIPGSALQTIDGAGHAVMLEQPRRVAALLSVFLKTIPYTPGV